MTLPVPETEAESISYSDMTGQWAQAVRDEELAGRKMATLATLAAILIIAVWLFIQVGPPRVYYYEAILAVFAIIYVADHLVHRSRYGRPWHAYVFTTLSIALLVFTLVVPNPFVDNWPTQMRLRYGNFVYLLAFLGPIALSFSPGLMLWAGISSALLWGIGVAWVMAQPGTLGWGTAPPGIDLLAAYLDPRFVDMDARIQDGIVVLLLAGVLALVVWRSRRLVVRQIAAARERANLARYFPPNVVEQLARLDKPLGRVGLQPVAVMFVDIVGFSRLAERDTPQRVFECLRQFHARVEHTIFDHGGTLDKFLGDGVMATFGTPSQGPRDAANAISCARAILATLDAWNREREQAGLEPIRPSVGLHFGEVLLGDIGSARRLEFAVLGDAVNVANRLEALTRDLSCRVVISDDFVQALRREAGDRAEPLLDGFREGELQQLRGRDRPVGIWTLAAAEAVPAAATGRS